MANLPGTIQMSSRLRKCCMFNAGKKHAIDEHHVTHLYILYIFHSIPSLAFWHPHLQRMHAACSQPHHFPAIPVSHTVSPSASLHPWFWQTGWIDRGWIDRHAACAYVLSNVPFILPTYPILFLLSACLSNVSWQKVSNSLNMCRSIHKVFRYCLCVSRVSNSLSKSWIQKLQQLSISDFPHVKCNPGNLALIEHIDVEACQNDSQVGNTIRFGVHANGKWQ